MNAPLHLERYLTQHTLEISTRGQKTGTAGEKNESELNNKQERLPIIRRATAAVLWISTQQFFLGRVLKAGIRATS